MPNSPTQRMETCLPPKKFAWRFDAIKNHSTTLNQEPLQTTKNSPPLKPVKHIMGLLSEIKINSSQTVQQASAMEPVSPAKSIPEDTPLDFSVRHETPRPSQEKVRSHNEQLSNGLGPNGTMFVNNSECLKRLQGRSSIAFPGIPNTRSPPIEINGHSMHFNGVEESTRYNSPTCNANQKSTDIDCSENSRKHLNGLERTDVNGEATLHRQSPGSPIYSRESSPAKENSILQDMLTAPQIPAVNGVASKTKEIHVNTSESFQRGDMGYPVMTSPNQPIAPCLLSPINNIMSLPMSPFYGGMGFMGPAISPLHGPMASLLSQAPENSMIHALTSRRQKKKKDGERPFKAYTIDVLQEKLRTANALSYNLDYNKQMMARSHMVPTSPSSDDPTEPGPSGFLPNGKNCPTANESASTPTENKTNATNESPEYVNGAINQNNTCPTNGGDNQTSVCYDSNDSLPSASPEGVGGPNGVCRKRKTTNDAEKDEAYWDKRKKNNLAAKRSREARRRKEDAIANMVVIFEKENNELKNHLAAANFHYTELNILYNRVMQENEAMKIQNNILQERLSQKRCGQCGAKLPNVN